MLCEWDKENQAQHVRYQEPEQAWDTAGVCLFRRYKEGGRPNPCCGYAHGSNPRSNAAVSHMETLGIMRPLCEYHRGPEHQGRIDDKHNNA